MSEPPPSALSGPLRRSSPRADPVRHRESECFRIRDREGSGAAESSRESAESTARGRESRHEAVASEAEHPNDAPQRNPTRRKNLLARFREDVSEKSDVSENRESQKRRVVRGEASRHPL